MKMKTRIWVMICLLEWFRLRFRMREVIESISYIRAQTQSLAHDAHIPGLLPWM
jgi:hypothetical protein